MSVGPPTPPGGFGMPDEGFFDGMLPLPPAPSVSPNQSETAEPVDVTPDIDSNTENSGTPVTTPPFGSDGDEDFPAFEPTTLTSVPVTEQAAEETPTWPRKPSPEEMGYEDDDALEADREMARKIYSSSALDLLRVIAAEPDPQHLYVDELKAIISVSETKRAYDREMAKQAVDLTIAAQNSGDLMAAFERAMVVDQAAILEKVTDDDYDAFDRIIIGNREQDIKLVGQDHMVRILATKKAGKTTSIFEIMRCSVTGEPVFGSFDIQPIAEDETILFIDPELGPRDYEEYVKQGFSGMAPDQINRIKRFSLRHQGDGVDPETGQRTPPAVFDLSSESTRDVLISICNRFNVARIFFDSYIKLIPGSMNKDDDVKRMLAHWAAIHGSTPVRESFWVGHINNSGEVRSSGSMLLDGTFESLLAITIDATDRRFFQAQAGRMTDAMEPKEIILDPETNRPVILLEGGAVPLPIELPNGPGKPQRAPAKGSLPAEEQAEQSNQTVSNILKIMGPVGPTALKNGAVRRGGFAKEELARTVLERWTEMSRFVTQTTKTAVITIIGEMVAKGLLISEHPVSGVKKLWLSETGEAAYLEIQGGS